LIFLAQKLFYLHPRYDWHSFSDRPEGLLNIGNVWLNGLTVQRQPHLSQLSDWVYWSALFHLPTACKECVIVVLQNYPILVDTSGLTHSTACIVAMLCSVQYSWDCQAWYSFLHPCLPDPRVCGPCPLWWLSCRLDFPVFSVDPMLLCCLSIWHICMTAFLVAIHFCCSCSLNILLSTIMSRGPVDRAWWHWHWLICQVLHSAYDNT